jgi:putative alpha-1,2-mannosidase
MSAWYLFSTLGFYPVCPGSEDYAIGNPLVKYAEIDMGRRKNLEIIVENQCPENVYVQEVSLNGTPIEGFNLRHREISRGGKLIFVMGSTPPKPGE